MRASGTDRARGQRESLKRRQVITFTGQCLRIRRVIVLLRLDEAIGLDSLEASDRQLQSTSRRVASRFTWMQF
jgi:hypothetical protein